MKDVIFEIEGDPKAFDDGRKRKLTYKGYSVTGRGEDTIVVVTHYHEDDDGNELTDTVPINYAVYESLKEAFEYDAFEEPGTDVTFEIREPIDP